MKRLVALTSVVLLLAVGAGAELSSRTVGATSTSQTFIVNASSLLVVNDGSNEVYVRVFWDGETPADATTAYAEIKAGEAITYSRTIAVYAISIVCASTETATVRLQYW